MLLEKINCYQNKRMSLQFSINTSDQLQAPYISSDDQSITAIEKKFKIESQYSFNHLSTETVKRIIDE